MQHICCAILESFTVTTPIKLDFKLVYIATAWNVPKWNTVQHKEVAKVYHSSLGILKHQNEPSKRCCYFILPNRATCLAQSYKTTTYASTKTRSNDLLYILIPQICVVSYFRSGMLTTKWEAIVYSFTQSFALELTPEAHMQLEKTLLLVATNLLFLKAFRDSTKPDGLWVLIAEHSSESFVQWGVIGYQVSSILPQLKRYQEHNRAL